ncbi:MAG: 3-deoxy-manno-octulosonate cytidylyltransferase [Burkholderiales bacterium]|jgi:3-deoxy-manno-octulosonate cytidylyltransferase (CMP-KDO synthetase)|nr:3-deoxy-manno-octulosonate cytidylyltransferase [Burkholderiales bacterium]
MKEYKFTIIIPARMQSGRLPNKMVLDLDGLPLVVRTAKQAHKSSAASVIVATDHDSIVAICKEHGIDAIMTRDDHHSGTDRIAEAASSLGLAADEIIINVQGDEPLIDPILINDLAAFTHSKQAEFATIAHPIHTEAEIFNPHIVKVVLDKDSNALYFSRSPIPFYRDGFNNPISEFKLPPLLNLLRHIGMYAYTGTFLKNYSQMPVSPLESIEALEQLRILYNGHKIAVLVSDTVPEGGVDTKEDLERIRQALSKH